MSILKGQEGKDGYSVHYDISNLCDGTLRNTDGGTSDEMGRHPNFLDVCLAYT